MTGELIWSIVGGSAAVSGLLILGGTLWYNKHKANQRKKALNDPCEIGYENEKNDIRYLHAINTSPEPQSIKIRLKFKTEVNVKFMYICFEGESKPQIEEVYEWNMPAKYDDKNITTCQMEDGAWHWNYSNSLHKNPNTNIRIGIKCIARNSGCNSLIVYLGCDEAEASKPLKLPLEVNQGD